MHRSIRNDVNGPREAPMPDIFFKYSKVCLREPTLLWQHFVMALQSYHISAVSVEKLFVYSGMAQNREQGILGQHFPVEICVPWIEFLLIFLVVAFEKK